MLVIRIAIHIPGICLSNTEIRINKADENKSEGKCATCRRPIATRRRTRAPPSTVSISQTFIHFIFFLHSENTSRFLNVCFCFYLLSEREKYESPAAFRTVSAL